MFILKEIYKPTTSFYLELGYIVQFIEGVLNFVPYKRKAIGLITDVVEKNLNAYGLNVEFINLKNDKFMNVYVCDENQLKYTVYRKSVTESCWNSLKGVELNDLGTNLNRDKINHRLIKGLELVETDSLGVFLDELKEKFETCHNNVLEICEYVQNSLKNCLSDYKPILVELVNNDYTFRYVYDKFVKMVFKFTVGSQIYDVWFMLSFKDDLKTVDVTWSKIDRTPIL